jgi:hypothetical protein
LEFVLQAGLVVAAAILKNDKKLLTNDNCCGTLQSERG